MLREFDPTTAVWTSWRTGARLAWTMGLIALMAAAVWIAFAEPAPPLPRVEAKALPPGAAVRVQLDRLGEQWLEGRVFTAPLGCTLVRLDEDRRAGASSVPLQAVREMQRAEASGQWASVPIASLLATERPGCATA